MTITETFLNFEQLKVAEKYTKNLKARLYFIDKKSYIHRLLKKPDYKKCSQLNLK
jgi:hypothetical protein